MSVRERRLVAIAVGVAFVVAALVLLRLVSDDSSTVGPTLATSTTSAPSDERTASGPVRPGTVGFLGDETTLTVIGRGTEVPDDTVWVEDHGYLRVNGDDLVLDGVLIRGGLDFYGSGTLTIRNSVIEGGHGGWQILMLRDTGSRLELTDSTLRWNPAQQQEPGTGPGAIHISGSHSMMVARNDISGLPDGMQVHGNDIRIIDNWIHDLEILGSGAQATHNDGIQLYEGSTNVAIVGNWIDAGGVEGNSNAAVFAGGASSGEVRDNHLNGGGYALRLREGSWAVSGNEFGADSYFGEAAIEGVELIVWESNLDAEGREVAP